MKTVLIAVDFSQVSEQQVNAVDNLLDAGGAKVEILHVINPVPEYMGYGAYTAAPDMSLEDQIEILKGMVGELGKRIKTPDVEITSRLLEGDAVPKILKEQKAIGADLIVIGSHGHGAIYNLLVGSVAEGVMRKSTCPVLVVPAANNRE